LVFKFIGRFDFTSQRARPEEDFVPESPCDIFSIFSFPIQLPNADRSGIPRGVDVNGPDFTRWLVFKPVSSLLFNFWLTLFSYVLVSIMKKRFEREAMENEM
jgi:hypothetical protein